MDKEILRDIESNIILWYDFEKESKVLLVTDEADTSYQFLKDICKYVEYTREIRYSKEDYFDYLVILKDEIQIEEIINISKCLKEDGIILYAFDNEYGISKFVSYNRKDRISPLEQSKAEKLNKDEIIKKFNKNGFIYSNLYMPFPNWKNVDVIFSDKLNDLSEKIDRYFVKYNEEDVIVTDEINLLKNIAKYDKDLFTKLSNSYLLEISKQKLNTDARYISFNNYRKKEYMLATIIKSEIVEKKAITKEAYKNIDRIAKNLKFLKNYNCEILDKYENKKLISKYIKNKKTLDYELYLHHEDRNYLYSRLNEIKDILLQNSIKYNSKDRKHYCEIIKKYDEKILEELNYLEYGFYDMIPKNCFYVDEKYYFFDQEWMEKYIPVEFIIYRAIINSYDLVKNIDVDEILNELKLIKYKEMFEELDFSIRNNILDKQRYEELDKKYTKMYEIMYDNEILKMQNEQYRINDIKQNEYIKKLESDLKINN